MATILAGAGVLGVNNEADAANAPTLEAVFNAGSGIHEEKARELANQIIARNPDFEPYRSNIENAIAVLQDHQGNGWERVHKNKWNKMLDGNFKFAADTFPTSKWGRRASGEVQEFIKELGPLADVSSAADLKKTQDSQPAAKKEAQEKTSSAPTVKEEFDNKTKTLKDKVHEILKPHLALREGKKLEVYPDPVKGDSCPTVGIGHLVTEKDNLKIGDKITEAQCDAFYRKDTDKAVNAAIEQATELGVQDNVKFVAALASVNFQLGTKWNVDVKNDKGEVIKQGHKKTWALMKEGKYAEAAVEAADSGWNKQTPTRVKDFQDALRQLEKDLTPAQSPEAEKSPSAPNAPGV